MGVSRKARMRLIIFLLSITIGLFTLAQANSDRVSVASVQQTPPTGTYFDHLVFIIMENAGMSNICGSTNPPPCNGPDNPYMSGLANSYGIATRYVDLTGTSQPNYIGITAATLNGCTSSCGPGTLTETNLVDRFEAAGLGWKAYMENQTPVSGCDNSDHGFYEIGHNPFLAFQDIDTSSTRCSKIILANPANNSTCTGTDCALTKDLNSGSAPNFMWVTPNDCNNAHGASGCANGCISSYTSSCEKAGDNYLSSLVPNILNSNTFKNTRAALFITFDEGNGFCPLNGSGEDCMYTVWAGPTAKTNSFSNSTLYNHYSFTKTIETNWSLATMTSNDASAIAMTSFFTAQAPDFSITASPASLSFPTGNSASSTITLNSVGSFAGTVTLTKTSTPTGLTLTLNPTSITLTAGGTGTSTLTASSSTLGNYTATVTGTGSGHTHNTTLTVHVTPPPNFALSVSPTSLTLTHAVSGVASPVAVTPTGDPTVFESSYLANSFYAKGLYWLFYEDSSNTCEHQAGCLTYTTSTNGSRWAASTTVPVHITDSDFSVTTNGTSIFYARYNESSFITDCGRKLQLGIGNLSNSGSVTWQPEKTVIAGASNRVYVNDEIILDSNGQIWIGYLIDNHGACGGNGTDLPLVMHSAGTNYSVWTGNTTLSTANSGNWHIALVSLGSGQVYAAYWIATHDVHGRLYNGGWQGDEQISSTGTLSDVNAWLFNSGTNVYTIYFDDSTKSFDFASRSSTGTWTINTIGIGESHTGFPGYYSLPDAASYDVANNQFHLFYMNATTQKIDEWAGSGNTWNKTTGVVSTTPVPYPDSISSFIQSNPTEVGGIFYTSGPTAPFTINFAALTFASTSLTGSFTVTVTSQNGFSGTVTLSTATNPSTGLTVTCTVTTIAGGSGSSTCNLSSTTAGSYNVNVTGVSGILSHSANVAVTVPSTPDFSITDTTPSPTNVGQSQTSTITVSAVNGFTGIVSLTDTPPASLTCTAISPNSITNSGTATVSCSASVAGNYTLTITGTSGSLNHSTTPLFQFRDFNASASLPSPVNAGSSAVSTLTITAINHFNGVVALTDTVPSGLVCGTISPSSLTGSGTATVSCSANVAGNYTLTLTGTSGSLVHTATSLFQFRNFTMTASSPSPANAGSSAIATITVTGANHFAGIVILTDTVPSGLTCGSITPNSLTGSGTATVSCSASVAGNYTLTLTGTNGSLVHTATSFFQFVNFTIAASPPSPADAGSSSITTFTVTSLNHFAGVVTLSPTVPSGLTCGSISPSSVTGSGTATISCTANVAGNYTLTVTGTSGSLVHSATALFQFRDFTLSATTPGPIDATQSANSTITITALNHFNGSVNLSDTVPLGLTCGTITPASLTGSGIATLSCSASVAGNYTLTITGLSGSLTHSAQVIFMFQDFTISATSPAPANAATSTSSTITITALNHFAGTVNLTDSIPSGLTCGAITPGSVTGSGTATVSCSATIAGNYTLTATATSSPLVHNATILFQYRDFAITISTVTDNAGASGTSTITISAVNKFAGTVTLTDTVPSGLTCGTISPTSITGSGTATVVCSASVAGNYTLTVTATSGSLVHTTLALFRVQDFTITATAPAPVNAGVTVSSTITLSAVNGFTGVLSLTDALPSSLTCGSITPGSITGSGTATVSCNATVAGNYTLTVTGASASLIHSATALFQFRDFTIAATSPAPISTGSSASSTITLTAVNHFAGSVSLSDTIPTGLTCGTITPSSITGSGTATISCNATVAGNYTLTMIGTSTAIVHSAVAMFRFQNFTISTTSPAPVSVGQSATSTITITSANGFAGVVTLNDTVPSGLTCGSIAPGSITGSGTATVSCSAAVAGTYILNVTGTSGTLVHTAIATFNFVDFSITASSPTPVNAGSSANSTITIASMNGAGTVSLNDTTPTGLTCGTIAPSSITGSGTANVSCSATVVGNYTLTVTGSAGSLIHSTTALLQFRDYTIITTSPAAANVGLSTSSTITVTALNHFSGTVSLTDTIPSGLTCGTISPATVTGSGTATVSCHAQLAGNYTLTLTGTSGPLVHVATSLFQFRDFNASASSPAPLNAGTSTISTITITAANHFNGVVSLTDIVPSGLACGAITPTSVTGSGTATVSCSATVAGNYTLTITGTNGTLSHSMTAVLSFQDYTISASLASVRINAGSTGSSTITIIPLNHFSGSVSISLSGASGLASSINPTTIPGGSGTAILTFSATAAGNYTVTISSSSAALTHTTTVSVQVIDFALVASPTTITILAGARGNSTVTIAALNGFTGTVNLALTPSMGLGATITPGSIPGSGTSTLIVSPTSSGDYSVMINATFGSLAHAILVTVHVLDYGLTGNPMMVVAPTGSSASSTLTIPSLNGYAGNLTLAFTVQAANITSALSGSMGGSRSFIMAPPAVLPAVSISPQSFQLFPSGTQQSTVAISLPSNLPAGNYLITVIASDGALSHQIVITLAATDFTITATPSSVSIRPGSNTTIVLNLQSLNFFQGNVTLTVNSPPGGPTGTLSASMVRLTFNSSVNLNLTINVPANTTIGNYTITIQAASGTVSHTLSIPVRVTTTGFVTVLAEILSSHRVAPITAFAIIALLTILATLKVRTYTKKGPGIWHARRIRNHNIRRSEPTRYVPFCSILPLFFSPTGADSSKL